MTAMLSVMVPNDITSAMLVSSTVPENEYPPWTAGVTFELGTRCVSPVTHKVYESAKTGNLNHDPIDITNRVGTTIWWFEVSMTNRWNMLDSKSGAQTVATSPLTVVLTPGAINAIYLNWLDADLITVSVKDKVGGNEVFPFSAELECSYPADFYAYCFAPYKQQTDILIENIPMYLEPEVTITLSKTSGSVKCGSLQVGDLVPLGRALSGAKSKPKGSAYIGLNANKENEVKTRKRPSRDLVATALVELEDADTVSDTASALIDIPALWSISGSPQLAALRSFGVGTVELSYDHTSHCILNLNVIGIST